MTDDQRAAEQLSSRIRSLRQDFAQLLFVWHHRADAEFGWITAPGIHAELAHAFIELGAPLVGLEERTSNEDTPNI